MDTFTTVLSVFSTVCAIVFGYIAFVRNRDKDKESNVKHDATVLTEIGYIKANTDEIKAEQREQRRLSEHREIPDDELIFRAVEGGLVDVCNTTRVIRRCCKRAGIPPVSCHALRATFATRCVESGTDYKSLSEHLGHKDIGVTMNVYAKALDDTKEKEISKVHIV